jgi:hypothetical protein
MTHSGLSRKEKDVINSFWECLTRMTKDGGGKMVLYRTSNFYRSDVL